MEAFSFNFFCCVGNVPKFAALLVPVSSGGGLLAFQWECKALRNEVAALSMSPRWLPAAREEWGGRSLIRLDSEAISGARVVVRPSVGACKDGEEDAAWSVMRVSDDTEFYFVDASAPRACRVRLPSAMVTLCSVVTLSKAGGKGEEEVLLAGEAPFWQARAMNGILLYSLLFPFLFFFFFYGFLVSPSC